MSDSTMTSENERTQRAHLLSFRRAEGLRVWKRIGAFAFILLVTGCTDLHLSARELVISPNPAVPGEAVTATFVLSLIPVQAHTIIVVIDDIEHLRETSSDAPDIPVVLDLGDAADLIAEYGTGAHAARIIVHVDDEVTRTRSVNFELNESTLQE